MPDINGIPYVESTDLVSAYPAASQALAQEVSDQLASKLPYSYGTATPSTTDSGFLWYDSNSTPAAPKFWDGAAFQALTSGKILQVVRATDGTNRTTSSSSYVDVTGMSVTITPQKSDSAVILIATFVFSLFRSTTGGISGYVIIADSSNNTISGAGEALFLTTGATDHDTAATLVGYATPATTSAVTYKLRQRLNVGTSQTIKNGLQTGQMYAIEVSA